MTDKQIYQIGLTMINGVGDILARHLLEALGDAEAVFTEKRQSLEKIPGIGDSIITEIKRADVLLRAEKELAFTQKNGISIYFLKDMNYPERLRECPDAPGLFFFFPPPPGVPGHRHSRVAPSAGHERHLAFRCGSRNRRTVCQCILPG